MDYPSLLTVSKFHQSFVDTCRTQTCLPLAVPHFSYSYNNNIHFLYVKGGNGGILLKLIMSACACE